MSRIDDELEQAVRDAEASHPVGNPEPGKAAGSVRSAAGDEARPVVADARRRAAAIEPPQERTRWGLLVALLALGGGILAIVLAGGKESVVYSYQVDEVKARTEDFGDRQLRVQGTLVYGSLVKRDNPCEHRFMMRKLGEKTGEALEVQYPLCVVPDTFREVKGVDVEVTAEGRLDAEGHLLATKIFAKCPSKYEMRESANKMGGQGPEHSVSAERAPIGPTAETSLGTR